MLHTCPNCGKDLVFIKNAPADMAPWLCDDCARCWWPSELLPKYRIHWDPVRRDFGSQIELVRADVANDRSEARALKEAARGNA